MWLGLVLTASAGHVKYIMDVGLLFDSKLTVIYSFLARDCNVIKGKRARQVSLLAFDARKDAAVVLELTLENITVPQA